MNSFTWLNQKLEEKKGKQPSSKNKQRDRSALGALAWKEDWRALGSFMKEQELYVERFWGMDAIK